MGDYIERLKKIRRRIEENDPKLVKLAIYIGESYTECDMYRPHDGDWERDGKSVGRSIHIKELVLGDHDSVSRHEYEVFCEGMAANKSIERLKIWNDVLSGGEIYSMMCPFFEQNSNLRCLRVGFHTLAGRFCDASVRLLSESLTRFNTLREFECQYCQLGDDYVATLVGALTVHSGITKLDLSGNKVGRVIGGVGGMGSAALAALLTSPKSSLKELELMSCSFNDEGAAILAAALTGNRTLTQLNLGRNPSITVTGWRAIFARVKSPQSSLEELRLFRNSINNATANLLANALTTSTSLKVLDLSEIDCIYGDCIIPEVWRPLFDALQNPSCALQDLDLHNNDFDDDDVTYLSNALALNCTLKWLDFRGCNNRGVTVSGWRAFSAVFRNPNSALETVNLRSNSINDDALVSFADGLRGNSKLENFFLNGDPDDYDDEYSEDTTLTRWDAFSHALCDKSSVNATFSSNHTLQRLVEPDKRHLSSSRSSLWPWDLADEPDLPPDLQNLLRLNRENTKIEASRRKILNVHFSGDFNMQPFISMDLKALPHAVAWMAKDEYGSSLLYQFVRYTTFFVGVGPAGRLSDNEPVSKRQKV